MDPVGLVSLLYDVSKDMYGFYMVAKGREDDLKEFRTQLLSLREKSGLIEEAISREGVKAEDKSKVDAALLKCEDAADELKSGLQVQRPGQVK